MYLIWLQHYLQAREIRFYARKKQVDGLALQKRPVRVRS
jgi:hypothetical protein